MINRKSFVTLFVFLLFLSINGFAFAESTVLSLDVKTDKEAYDENEEVNFTITVDNKSEFHNVENIHVVSTVPEGLEIINSDANVEGNQVSWDIDEIKTAEPNELTYAVKLKAEDAPDPEDPKDPKDSDDPKDDDKSKDEEESDDNDDAAATGENNNKTNAPQTGDATTLGTYYMILIASLALGVISILVLLFLRKKKVSKGITILLAMALVLPTLSIAKAEEANDELEAETVTKETVVEIGGNEYTFVTTVTGNIKTTSIPAEEVESIRVDPEELQLAPGDAGQFKLYASDGTDEVVVNHNEENIEYTVSDPDKIQLDKQNEQVNVTATENAQDGDVVTIDVSYQAGDETLSATVTVNIATIKGTLTGRVLDASDDSPIEGATVDIYKGDEKVFSTTTDAEGNYTQVLPVGTYDVRASHENYQPDAEQVTIEEGETATHDVVLRLIPDSQEPGIASGTITNAVTGESVEEVLVNVRAGKNNQSGEVVLTTTTDRYGEYEVELPAGNYTIEVSKEGYVTNFKNIIVIGAETKANQNATITPEMNETDIRIVLTWGEKPNDLDSHFVGPTADGDLFHVYFPRKSYADAVNEVELDVDDTYQYGPETITITKMKENGTYTYAVHDFSNHYYRDESKELSNSGAKVEVYRGNSQVQTFNVPTNQVGNVWRVFKIQNGEIVPVNQIGIIDDYRSPGSF